MKIKIIDLLNIIADREKTPKIIKYYGNIYEYDGENEFYYNDNGASLYREFYVNGNCLNDEVEIIEEDKQIEKIDLSEVNKNGFCVISIKDEMIQNKLNEVIDALNKIKEK